LHVRESCPLPGVLFHLGKTRGQSLVRRSPIEAAVRAALLEKVIDFLCVVFHPETAPSEMFDNPNDRRYIIAALVDK
jgi:hypothetical protein